MYISLVSCLSCAVCLAHGPMNKLLIVNRVMFLDFGSAICLHVTTGLRGREGGGGGGGWEICFPVYVHI